MLASNHFNGPLHFGIVSPIVCTTNIRCHADRNTFKFSILLVVSPFYKNIFN